MVMVYLNMINLVQANIVQSKIGLAYGWWPVHLSAILLVVFLFSWRLKINSRMHPLVLWSNLKCSLRGKDKSSS
jgi:lipopolysaccharide export system permease protein